MRHDVPMDDSLLLIQKLAHKKSITSSFLEAETFDGGVSALPRAAGVLFALMPLSVALLVVAMLVELFVTSKRFHVGQVGLRSLWFLLAVLATVDMSILIPISFDISQQLGYGPLASGVMVAASQAFQPFLALLSRWLVIGQSYQYQRRFMLICLGAEAILTWLMAPVLEACNHWSDQTVLYLLVFFRAMTGGVIMLYGVPLACCVYDSAPLEDRQSLSIRYYLFLSIGVCLGPVVSSVMLSLHQGGAHQACFTGRQSISILGFVWSAVALLSTWLLPKEIEETHEKDKTHHDEATGENSALSLAQAVQRIPVQTRRALVISAVLFSAERSFSIGAIEVATALLLEVEYSWSPEQIGYALGVIFFITAVVGGVIALLRRKVSDYTLMLSMATVSITGAMLFIDFGGQEKGHSSPWLLMVADVTVYSCMFQLTAFMEGIATEAAVPGTACSLENYIVARNLAIQIPRALGPPVARGLIDLCGRNTYAVLQLCLSSVAISGVWYAANTARSDAVVGKQL